MKRKMLFPLMICALALAGCYRQTEEPFQQVNSSEVEQPTDPLVAATAVESPGGQADAPVVVDASQPDASGDYITPEPPPGQVAQPTIVVSTQIVAEVPTLDDAAATRIFILPTATLTFAENLDPQSECVYSVLPGDNLYRLSIAFNTTVDDFFAANQLDSDALQIGQLLLLPGCEPSEPAATAEPEIAATDEATASPTEAPTAVPTLPPDGPRIHVVSAGQTLTSIALFYDVTVADILAANDMSDADRITAGMELLIPEEDPPPEASELPPPLEPTELPEPQAEADADEVVMEEPTPVTEDPTPTQET